MEQKRTGEPETSVSRVTFYPCSLLFGGRKNISVANLDDAGGSTLKYLVRLKSEWAWRWQLLFFNRQNLFSIVIRD